MALAPLLGSLGIERLYSSPFRRCMETIQPFVEMSGLKVTQDERLVELKLPFGSYAIWTKCWDDFGFAAPGCESNACAQSRFVEAVGRIVAECHGFTVGICSHGGVIGLLLNHLDKTCQRACSEQLRNPDVLRICVHRKVMAWDRSFALAGLDEIASGHEETPVRLSPR